MKKIAALAAGAALLMSAIPVLAKGGRGSKSLEVCWIGGGIETRAYFTETGSGIIQQHRYSPDDKHLVFKPMSKFSEPDEGSWFAWKYTSQYDECDPASDTSLDDVLSLNTWYWVQINDQD